MTVAVMMLQRTDRQAPAHAPTRSGAETMQHNAGNVGLLPRPDENTVLFDRGTRRAPLAQAPAAPEGVTVCVSGAVLAPAPAAAATGLLPRSTSPRSSSTTAVPASACCASWACCWACSRSAGANGGPPSWDHVSGELPLVGLHAAEVPNGSISGVQVRLKSRSTSSTTRQPRSWCAMWPSPRSPTTGRASLVGAEKHYVTVSLHDREWRRGQCPTAAERAGAGTSAPPASRTSGRTSSVLR